MSRRSALQLGLLARHACLLGIAVVLFAAVAFAGARDGFFGVIRALYDTATVVLPAGILTVALLILVRRRSQPGCGHPVRPLLLVVALLLCTRYYASIHEPSQLRIRYISISSPRVARPLRILHISDIQVFEFRAYEQRALDLMKELQPDIILHTGDLTQPLHTHETPGIVDLVTRGLQQACAPLGVFGVTGDTDWRLAQAGVTADQLAPLIMLDNTPATVGTNGVQLDIYGMELIVSRNPTAAAQLVDHWLATNPEGLRIVIGHSPDYIMGLENRDIDIALAGHTHGGQVRLPFYGPLLTMTRHIPRAYARGHRMLGNTLFNVSAGIGSEHAGRVPPIRFLCPPEMTLITVTPATASTQGSRVRSEPADETMDQTDD